MPVYNDDEQFRKTRRSLLLTALAIILYHLTGAELKSVAGIDVPDAEFLETFAYCALIFFALRYWPYFKSNAGAFRSGWVNDLRKDSQFGKAMLKQFERMHGYDSGSLTEKYRVTDVVTRIKKSDRKWVPKKLGLYYTYSANRYEENRPGEPFSVDSPGIGLNLLITKKIVGSVLTNPTWLDVYLPWVAALVAAIVALTVRAS